jgi:YHS domain-containing protein
MKTTFSMRTLFVLCTLIALSVSLRVNAQAMACCSGGSDAKEIKQMGDSTKASGHEHMKHDKKGTEHKAAAGQDMKMTGDDKPEAIKAGDSRLKKMGIFNKVCPVQGEEIDGDQPAVLYKGKIYAFCCAGCDKKFSANPEKYLKNLSADGKTFIKNK